MTVARRSDREIRDSRTGGCSDHENAEPFVLTNAESQKNWSAGGIQAPVAQATASNKNSVPSPCFILLQAEDNRFVYDTAITRPTRSIWNCDPQNNYRLTSQQFSALSG